jgi:hypothetical protein
MFEENYRIISVFKTTYSFIIYNTPKGDNTARKLLISCLLHDDNINEAKKVILLKETKVLLLNMNAFQLKYPITELIVELLNVDIDGEKFIVDNLTMEHFFEYKSTPRNHRLEWFNRIFGVCIGGFGLYYETVEQLKEKNKN